MDRETRSTRRLLTIAAGCRTSAAATVWLAAGACARVRPGSVCGLRSGRNEGCLMLHVTCDLCGKKLHPGQDSHFVVKVEVFAAQDPAGLTEDDLDEDHMEAFSEMLRAMEDEDKAEHVSAAAQQMRFDLC